MSDLITTSFLEARYGDQDDTKTAALITDASALVIDYANTIGVATTTTDAWGTGSGDTTPPGAVQAVVAQMVFRGLTNPLGHTGENLGDASWQSNPRASLGVYLAPSERKIIRRAVGKSSVGTLQLEGYLPVEPETLLADEDLTLT